MRFSKKLKAVLVSLNLTQKEAAEKTGIGATSLSMYLKGQHEPPEEKKKKIALALGLSENYFTNEAAIAELEEIHKEGQIPSLKVDDVARKLGICSMTVRKGLQQGVFPWGYAIKTSENRWAYFINASRFRSIEMLNGE